MKILFLLFIVLPIAEILVLIEVGGYIGTLNTAVLVVLTALIGSFLLREQGVSTLFRARQRLEGGELPLQEMLEGICLAVGGALLVTPGFITDIIGFCCLLPLTRRGLIALVVKHANIVTVSQAGGYSYRSDSDDVIDGEFKREDDSSDHPRLR